MISIYITRPDSTDNRFYLGFKVGHYQLDLHNCKIIIAVSSMTLSVLIVLQFEPVALKNPQCQSFQTSLCAMHFLARSKRGRETESVCRESSELQVKATTLPLTLVVKAAGNG